MPRENIRRFRDIPNIGPAIEKDLIALGLNAPTELAGKDPYRMYQDLCAITRHRQDPCVLDVFMSAVSYMEGGPEKKWWEYTEERKQRYGI